MAVVKKQQLERKKYNGLTLELQSLIKHIFTLSTYPNKFIFKLKIAIRR